MNNLKKLYDKVNNSYAEFGKHGKEFDDAIFDLNTAESLLMGIADQLLSNMSPTVEQLMILDVKLMRGQEWVLFDGGSCDLSTNDQLFKHASLLASLQKECLSQIRNINR
jgi:hypothetical protein